MSKSKSDDRELQIELAKSQLDGQFYMTAAFGLVAMVISVLALFETLYFTLPSDQAVMKNGLPYLMTVLVVAVLPSIWFLLHKTLAVEERIEGLKDRFLSKQRPTEVKENQITENKTQGRNWKLWLRKTENKTLVVLIIGLCITASFTALNTYHEWNPPAPPVIRAKLTIFIDYPQFMRATDSTVTDVTVNIKVVNDSPLTATIREWNLYLNYNMPYEILNKVARSGSLMLSPSTQTDFTITTTLEGENHTVLPDTAIRSIVFTISHQDDSGLQTATSEYDFA